MTEVLVPDIGDYKDVEIIEIPVQAGDTVAAEDTIITLETDKATMDIPAPQAGVIKKLLVKVGDRVTCGDKIAELDAQNEDKDNKDKDNKESAAEPNVASDSKAVEPKSEPKSEVKIDAVVDNSSKSANSVYASPSVRRLAAELNINLNNISGTGKKGRIQKTDLLANIKNKMQPGANNIGSGALNLAELPEVNFANFGEISTEPLSRIKKLSGQYLHRNWVHIPHVTQFDSADITELEDFRKSQKELALSKGIKLTPLVFLMKAVVSTLKMFPQFNSSLDVKNQQVILKHYYHIGVAVDTPNGLVVPVVRNVDSKGIFDLAQELGEISQRARDGKLTSKDLQGGCFSISSLGGIGGTAFTPIVNLPEVAILGVSKAAIQPVYDGKAFQPRLMLPISLSYDHRVIDGADGARFTTYLVQQLSDIRRILL